MATKVIQADLFQGISVLMASKIYKEINASGATGILYKDEKSADAASVVDVLALGADKNSKIKIIVYGNNEDKIVSNISEILMDGAGI
jgi:phosphotransferase system HPr (HPr) family protein